MKRVQLCIAAAALVLATTGTALARPAARKTAPVPREIVAEGVCRFTVSQGGEARDETRFRFRSAELALPRRGAVTPVMAFREFMQDLPEGAPESERGVYAREVARYEISEEPKVPGESGPARWSRARAAAGLAPGRESQVLGLPWLVLGTPRAGQSWERTETIQCPRFHERFRYRILGMTLVNGRRAWKVERQLAARPTARLSLPELKAPARLVRWEETFWVDAGGQDLLRAERRLRFTTEDESPVELTVETDWARTGARPVPADEVHARATLFARLGRLESQVVEASARTTLDGAVDLRTLKNELEDLRDGYSGPSYQAAFEKVEAAIDAGIQQFQEREEVQRRQGRLAPPFMLPDGAGRATALASFRGQVVLLSFWSAA